MITVEEFEAQKDNIIINLNNAIDNILDNENNKALIIVANQIKAIRLLKVNIQTPQIYYDAKTAYMRLVLDRVNNGR